MTKFIILFIDVYYADKEFSQIAFVSAPSSESVLSTIEEFMKNFYKDLSNVEGDIYYYESDTISASVSHFREVAEDEYNKFKSYYFNI